MSTIGARITTRMPWTLTRPALPEQTVKGKSGGAVKDSSGSGPEILRFRMFQHQTHGSPAISDSRPHKQSHHHRSSHILSLPPFIHTHSHTLTLFLHPRHSFLCPFTRRHDAMDTDANRLKNRLLATCSQGTRPRASCLLCPSPLHPCRIANIAHPFEAVKSLRTHRPPQPRRPLSLARAWLHLIVL